MSKRTKESLRMIKLFVIFAVLIVLVVLGVFVRSKLKPDLHDKKVHISDFSETEDNKGE